MLVIARAPDLYRAHCALVQDRPLSFVTIYPTGGQLSRRAGRQSDHRAFVSKDARPCRI